MADDGSTLNHVSLMSSILSAIAQRESANGVVGIGTLADATGIGPRVVVNEVERLILDEYLHGRVRKTMSGGDPRPWFLLNPLLSERGRERLARIGNEKETPAPAVGSTEPAKGSGRRDAFISHASEDKADFVAELARELNGRGLKIWYDDDVLEVGDSVRKAIDEGLRASDFGIVVISPDFMRKDWTNRELDGLLAIEHGEKRLLPVWHLVRRADVEKYSPTVAGRLAVRSSIGVSAVADALCRAMKRGTVLGAPVQPASEPEPGSLFMSQVRQMANGRVYGWVVIGTATEDSAKFTDDRSKPIYLGWLPFSHGRSRNVRIVTTFG